MNDSHTDAEQSLVVNGRECRTSARTLGALLEHLKLDPQKVVAEVNGAIIPKENFSAATLADGDIVELVRFVGGG
jgi:thiamine biosynthesis protein ThiS